MALTKAAITLYGEKEDTFNVLFNPSEYVINSSNTYATRQIPGLNHNVVQFISGNAATLSMTLFLDTHGQAALINTSTVAGKTPEPEDVRVSVAKLSSALAIAGSLHAPPLVLFAWGSLKFTGVLENLSVSYVMFMPDGKPVRARAEVTFRAALTPKQDLVKTPRESPDRTKRRVLEEGMQLWHLAQREYGDPAQWRVIADANGIINPRIAPQGNALKVPSL